MAERTNTAYARWSPEGSPLAIEYPLEVMARIRDAVIIGFHRLAKRGIEVGGILYGTREGRRITIVQAREIRCSYKSGPSFVLSDADHQRLSDQLGSREADLGDLAPVGFYVSHTKDDLSATERDIAIYNTYFGAPWQVMLILRPARQGAVRAGFFVREPLGEFNAQRSIEEFELSPPDSAAETAALMAAARAPIDSAPTGQTLPARSTKAVAPEETGQSRQEVNGGSSGGGGDGDRVASNGDGPAEPAFLQGSPFDAPSFTALTQQDAPMDRLRQAAVPFPNNLGAGRPFPQRVPTRERHWTWLGVWLFAIVAIAGMAYWALSIRSPAPLLLRVMEQNGDLHIEWDRTSSSVRSASTASLEIRDGARTRDIRLSPEQLALGSYLFPIGASDIAVRLSVDGFLMPRVEESANYVAQAQAGAGPRGATEVREQRDRLMIENRRLRNDIRRLEERVKVLEERARGSRRR
jgi:hypothetical protein